jgi:cytochrome c biogenesis protein CcmG/thiol:disulfide interchange protein DsbE
VRIAGINYKDQADNARRFLGRYGNPFGANGVDGNGRAAIEWGVYGVPETFVVGRDGHIAYKLIGPITPENLDTALKPALEKALAAQP